MALPCPKPRIIIVGAGISGLCAAHRLSTSNALSCFDIIILEASQRIGGRICSSSIGGERVELGATWIHGIEGSPVREIAESVGAMEGDLPWECMDGFPESPVVTAEGGSEIHPGIVRTISNLYRKLYSVIQHTDGGLQQFEETESGTFESFGRVDNDHMKGKSVGYYLREGLDRFLSAQPNDYANDSSMRPMLKATPKHSTEKETAPPVWNLRSLHEGVFVMRENLERSVTGADSLDDLNLESNDEYWEYPGEHQTIGKGYCSVVNALAAGIPDGIIRFGKKVKTISWLNSNGKSGVPVKFYCEDGTTFDADHAIVTVSLGVLKAEALAHCKITEQVKKYRAPLADGEEDTSLFHPPLPSWKTDVISRLGFGVVDKVFLLVNASQARATYPHMQLVFRQNGHEKCEETAQIPWWMRKNFSLYPIHTRSHVLCTWFTGKEALKVESLSSREVVDGVLKTMASFGFKERIDSENELSGFRNLQDANSSSRDFQSAQVCEVARSGWGSNPLFRGSYSYVAVGSSGLDIDTLAEPLPRFGNGDRREMSPLQLLFAGEATHRYCYSTTHGAFLSGLREAERLLKHYGFLSTD